MLLAVSLLAAAQAQAVVPGPSWPPLTAEETGFVLPAEALQPALAPRFAGVFRPGRGFQAVEKNDATWGRALSAGELLPWQLIPGAEHLLQEEGVVDTESDRQVIALVLHYASHHPDPSGRSGALEIALEDPRSGEWLHWELDGVPLGGAEGESRSWTVVLDLRGGHEFLLPAGSRLRWAVATDAPDTGFLLSREGIADHDSIAWVDRLSDSIVARTPIGLDEAGLALGLRTRPAGNLALYPQDGEEAPSLDLSADAVAPGETATWRVDSPRPDLGYALLISAAPGLESTGGGLLLVDRGAMVARPVILQQGEVELAIPSQAHGVWYSQVVAFEGRYEQGRIRAVSNALRHALD